MKEDQLREDQRREALARLAEPSAEETLPPPQAVEPAPRFDEPAPAPRVEVAPPARIDAKEALETAGLVMIETKSHAPQQIAEQPQQLGRPRRERPKQAPQEETLEQVETRK